MSPLKSRYRDYSRWQNSEAKKEEYKKQEAFWLDQFKGEIPLLDLPADFPRPEVIHSDGDALEFEIGEEKTGVLKRYVLEQNVTLYMLLLALFNILLAKLSGQEDIVVGTPVACRNHADLQDIFGRFANTVGMRNYPKKEKTFREFLQEVRERTLKAFENQEYRFRDLVDALGVRDKHPTHNPLMDVTFALENIVLDTLGIPQVKMPDLQVSPYKFGEIASMYDLALTAREEGDTLHFSLRYRTGLFKRGTVEKFVSNFKQIVSAVLENPGKKISEI